MKTIGVLGGMSWESTLPSYRIINETVRERLGGLHSARLLVYSVDFYEVEQLQRAGDWAAAGALLARAARALEGAGAELLVLATNTMHCVAAAIEQAVQIPLLHIADATGAAVTEAGFHTVGVLGTRFTLEQDFYIGRLRTRHRLRVLIPAADERAMLHRIIFEELCQGQLRASSRRTYRQIMQNLVEAGAEAIVLACTEIGLLVGPGDAPVALFDTAAIHARQAALRALAPGNV